MALTLEQYVTYLDSRDTPWPAPPEPATPRAKPHLPALTEIRAVTWNIYGTLLAISGGELVFEHPQPFIMEMALDKTIQEFNMWASMTRKSGKPSDYMKQIYVELLKQQEMAPGLGKYPEIASERIWEAVLKKLLQKDYKFDAGFFGALNEYSAKIAYYFHASLQGTACYPGAAAALARLGRQQVTVGLLADAQSFTTAQLQRGLAAQDPEAKLEDLIDPELRSLSCAVGVRKPNELLLRHSLEAFRDRGIAAEQILHVGSRITEDIVPAKRLGMRTALYAGDSASLKASAEQLKTPESRPDILLTMLDQIGVVAPGT